MQKIWKLPVNFYENLLADIINIYRFCEQIKPWAFELWDNLIINWIAFNFQYKILFFYTKSCAVYNSFITFC